MTNYERIKAMSIEEMARFFSINMCISAINHEECMKRYNCVDCMWCWLNSESEGGEQE